MDTLMMLIKQEQEVQVVEVDTLKIAGPMEQQEIHLLLIQHKVKMVEMQVDQLIVVVEEVVLQLPE
tara:strand:+ start:147 stop:344 length:198 start_codon:yes stop_codon:yes gene_type:complete